MLSFLPSELTRTARAVLAATALAAVAIPQAQAVGVSGQGTWETTLQGRNLYPGVAGSGYQAYYDTALNITWLANASANVNFDGANGSFGNTYWDVTNAWIENFYFGGYSDWRLPTVVDTGAYGCDFGTVGGTDCGWNVQTKDTITGTVYNELAHMWYVTLGNKAPIEPGTGASQLDYGLENTGPFSNVQTGWYWTGVENSPYPSSGVWSFLTYDGWQSQQSKSTPGYTWLVRSGDVIPVPEPSTYALMGLGLAAVLVARRRRV